MIRKLREYLTIGQRFELRSQCWGPPRHFENEAERRRAWIEHKRELLDACRPGERPAAWWVYDAGEHPRKVREGWIAADRRHPSGYAVPIYEHETETLIRRGEATPSDIAELRRLVDWCQGSELGGVFAGPVDLARQERLLRSLGV
jgi:hypothetical protein